MLSRLLAAKASARRTQRGPWNSSWAARQALRAPAPTACSCKTPTAAAIASAADQHRQLTKQAAAGAQLPREHSCHSTTVAWPAPQLVLHPLVDVGAASVVVAVHLLQIIISAHIVRIGAYGGLVSSAAQCTVAKSTASGHTSACGAGAAATPACPATQPRHPARPPAARAAQHPGAGRWQLCPGTVFRGACERGRSRAALARPGRSRDASGRRSCCTVGFGFGVL